MKELIVLVEQKISNYKDEHREDFVAKIGDNFVCNEYKYIAYLFDGLQIVKSVVPELKDIPDGPQIVKTFKNHYRKRIILFCV